MPVNIEIKARTDRYDDIRRILEEDLHAEYRGEDHQIDTYYNVPASSHRERPDGRLKLRRGTIEKALIYYERDDLHGPKRSDVLLHPVGDEQTLDRLLEGAFGIMARVDKLRRIYFIGNVKIHLDKVKSLGTFVEIEAISDDGIASKRELREQCDQYMRLFGIRKEDLMEGSYRDMILSKTTRHPSIRAR